jgi:hypothetical protein
MLGPIQEQEPARVGTRSGMFLNGVRDTGTEKICMGSLQVSLSSSLPPIGGCWLVQ